MSNKFPMSPSVSVIMPCFNHARYIANSIESVLSQSYSNLELLITDDCSSDNSKEIIEAFRNKDTRIVSIYNRANLGASNARNMAIKACRGDYIAFCDADDLWEKEKIKIQIECLQSRREYDVVFCDSLIINEKGLLTGEKFSSQHGKAKDVKGNIFHELCLSNFINTPSVLLRKECIDKVGLFNENIKYIEDWFYWITLAHHFRFIYIDAPLVKYRVHSNSSNKDQTGLKKQRIEVCKLILNSFPDLPNEIKSALAYNIARDDVEMGNKSEAFLHYLISIRYKKTNLKSLLRMITLPFSSRRIS
jgi:glycosyltransferase involved in cell wall biosynthesis